MIKSVKKISKRKKWMIFISFLLLFSLISFYFLRDKGVTYTLPKTSKKLNSNRKIQNYLGNEFEWFLYTPDYVPLYIKETGKGETLITLHGGFGMTHDYMRSFMKPYEKHFHVVYFDQRGSLRSPVPNFDFEKHITLENMVNDLELLRRELKVKKIKIIAHSMGALLAYEYIKKFPENVGDLIIISGFGPKFPDSNAAFNDLFTSQKEREVFSSRETVKSELKNLESNVNKESAEYLYLNYKINSSSLQIFNIENWINTTGGVGFFNPKMNELIGPESNIPLTYMFKFYLKQRQFNEGSLDVTDIKQFSSPINYIPTIEKHSGKIDFLLGTHEVGDWNLRLYKRYIKQTDRVKNTCF